MGSNAARLGLLSAFAMALAACSSANPPEVDPNIYPTKYKDEILYTITPVFDDPTNVRDAYVTDPVLRPIGKDQRYTVCVRSNSRSLATRQYMGIKDRIAFFYGGHLNQLVEATKEQCGNAAYKPFPELEKLCLAKRCD